MTADIRHNSAKLRRQRRKERKRALAQILASIATKYPCGVCGGSGARFSGHPHAPEYAGNCYGCLGSGTTEEGERTYAAAVIEWDAERQRRWAEEARSANV